LIKDFSDFILHPTALDNRQAGAVKTNLKAQNNNLFSAFETTSISGSHKGPVSGTALMCTLRGILVVGVISFSFRLYYYFLVLYAFFFHGASQILSSSCKTA